MELKKFKKWLVEKELENDLFMESIKCYQVESYKAAFLYSYLGFIDYIKNIIMDYKDIPKMMKEKKKNKNKSEEEIQKIWKERIAKLESEDKWEENTFQFIKEGSESNIFRLQDKIRNEFESKRILRNVCAHNKIRTINNSTVEDLWDFIVYSQPFFTINGSLDSWKENYERIVRYAEEKEYEEKIIELYECYNKMPINDKKSIFDWIINSFNKHFFHGNKDYIECFNIFMNLVFKKNDAQEYKWINDYNIKIHCFISIQNYKEDFNKEELRKYVYEKKYSLILELIAYGTNEEARLKILSFIYSKKYYLKWWKLLCNTSNISKLNDEIKDLIVKDNMFNEVFERFEENLYKYKSQYFYGEHNTNTFDYCNFNYYKNEIITMLYLIKDGKVIGEKAIDLKKRCKTLLNEYNTTNNYELMCEFFERYKEISEWIKISE